MNIDTQYESKLSVQGYGSNQALSGVEIVTLQLHSDDGGNFLEIVRLSDGNIQGLQEPFAVAQISMSVVLPGSVKAYHLHKKQDDLWFVPPHHRLLVNLHDIRQDSPTFDQHQRLVLGGGKSQLLRIPAGIAHGVKNCYDQPMELFYATTTQFNAADPDEFRLPWDQFGPEVWELTKG